MSFDKEKITLEQLKERIATFETRPQLTDSDAERPVSGYLTTPRGYVHEIFADPENADEEVPETERTAHGIALVKARGAARDRQHSIVHRLEIARIVTARCRSNAGLHRR